MTSKALASKSTAPKSSTVEVLPAVTDSLPTKEEASVSLIHASAKVVENTEAKVANLYAETGLYSNKSERSFEKLSAEYLRHRRMFPAADKRTLLGEDSCDLLGETAEYRASIARINEVARDSLVNSLRKEGLTVKGATIAADQELEKSRKSISRYIRIAVEAEARKLGPVAGATLLLAHGFSPSSNVPEASRILTAGMKLDDKGTLVVPPVAAPPVEQGDQAPPAEVAENVAVADAAEMGTTTGNPQGRLNLAVGEMRTAMADPRLLALPSKDRMHLALLVGKAAFELLLTIGESLEGADRIQVARIFEQVEAVGALRLSPEAVSK